MSAASWRRARRELRTTTRWLFGMLAFAVVGMVASIVWASPDALVFASIVGLIACRGLAECRYEREELRRRCRPANNFELFRQMFEDVVMTGEAFVMVPRQYGRNHIIEEFHDLYEWPGLPIEFPNLDDAWIGPS